MDINSALHQAAGQGRPADVHAVHRRAEQLRRRRTRLTATGAGVLAVVVASYVVTGPHSGGRERLAGPVATPAPAPSAAPSDGPARGTAAPTPGLSGKPGSRTELGIFLVEAQGDCSAGRVVERSVPQTPEVLRAALMQLFEGPTPAEAAVGLSGPVPGSPDLLRAVTVAGGTAHVDLAREVLASNNLGTSCAGTAFLTSIARTATRFPTVRRVCLTVEGDPRALYDLLQVSSPCTQDGA